MVMPKETGAACAACGAPEPAFLFTGRDEFYGLPGEFRVVLCRGCDLAFLDPMPSPGELALHYPENYYSFQPVQGLPSAASCKKSSWQKAHLAAWGYPGYAAKEPGAAARVMGMLRPEKLRVDFKPLPEFRNNGKLLDIGCGSGFYLSEMRKLGWDVSGVEFSAAACEAAQKHYGIPVYCGSPENAPFPEGSFDVVTLFETLEHLTDPVAALEKAFRLLKPGGTLILTVPNRRSPYAALFGAAYFPWELPRHLYHFSKKSLARLLRRSGFENFKITSFTPGASALVLSAGITAARKAGRHGLPENFWEHKTMLLKALTWGLKPLHLLLDYSGGGIHLEVRAKKA